MKLHETVNVDNVEKYEWVLRGMPGKSVAFPISPLVGLKIEIRYQEGLEKPFEVGIHTEEGEVEAYSFFSEEKAIEHAMGIAVNIRADAERIIQALQKAGEE